MTVITPELFADRGVAWAKAVFDVCNVVITNFGTLALAAIAVWQNLKTKAEVKERLDRQSAKIDANTHAITAVALATPAIPEVQKVDVINPPTDPVNAAVNQPKEP